MDVACDINAGVQGYEVVFRDNIGQVIMAAMQGHYQSFLSPLCAEVSAMLLGSRLANRMEFREITIFSDSLQLAYIHVEWRC